MLMTRSVIKPPTMTMAKGRCESDPMPCDIAAGSSPKCGDQHGHHDGTQAQNGSFDGCLFNGIAARAQLIDVLEHDDAGLHGNAEKREEANF